jgi:hypothetical protein
MEKYERHPDSQKYDMLDTLLVIGVVKLVSLLYSNYSYSMPKQLHFAI